jgi:hypothetical protein
MNTFEQQEVLYMALYDEEEVTLGVTLERVANCLNSQVHAFTNLDHELRQPESDDMSGRNSPFSESKAYKIGQRLHAWKEAKRNLYRFVKDLEDRLDVEVLPYLYAKVNRSQRQQFRSPAPESDREPSISHLNFQQPPRAPKLAESSTSGHRAFSSTSISSRCLEKSELTRPELAPPIPDRHPSHRISTQSTPGGAKVSLHDTPDDFTPPNLLPEEHRERAEKQKQLLLRGGERQSQKISPASPTSHISGIPPKTPSSSDSHARLPSTNSLSILYEDLQVACLTDSTPRASLVNVDTSCLRQSSRTQRPQQTSLKTPKRSSSLGLRLDIPPTPPDSGRRSHLPEIYPSKSGYFRDIPEEPQNLSQSTCSDRPSSRPRSHNPPSQMNDLHVSPASLAAQQAKEVRIQLQLARLERLKMATRHAEMNLESMRNGGESGEERSMTLDPHTERRYRGGMRQEREEEGWRDRVKRGAKSLLRGRSKRITITRV